MSQPSTTPDFAPSCHSDGTWYACGTGFQFVGCCNTDPCNDIGCPTGDLMPASFNPAAYGHFSDQQCSAGSWYTCNFTSPPFMGCCQINPCDTGCPQSALAAGFLSKNPTAAEQFNPVPPLSSPSTQASNTPDPVPDSDNTPYGAVAGGVAGGVAAIVAACLGVIWYLWRRSKKSRQQAQHQHEAKNIDLASSFTPDKKTSDSPINEGKHSHLSAPRDPQSQVQHHSEPTHAPTAEHRTAYELATDQPHEVAANPALPKYRPYTAKSSGRFTAPSTYDAKPQETSARITRWAPSSLTGWSGQGNEARVSELPAGPV